ncbi:hypothetical protein KP509_07G056200 [Ceratopteris richardii]|uniref:Uncharacterized protein n=1 Tax=Ceratopteris richardii TaxID=49495 RepID=A0A8T2UA54_CERRI|nr:hypothetical protein KP509_07G056200 [Ceratopteris richardii]
MAEFRFVVIVLVSLLLPIFLASSSVRADSELHSDGLDFPTPPKQPDAALLLELQNLKKQFQDLEEVSIQKDVVIHEKEKIIRSLQSELEGLKEKESLQYDNALNELGSKISQLEDDLKRTEQDLQDSTSKAKTLEAAQSLQSSKIKQLEKLVSEQKREITKAEKALRAAESTLVRVQAEVVAKDKELQKVHGGWLPPWTSIKLAELQTSATEQWSKYCQPLVDTTIKKGSEKISGVQKWAKPHVENLKVNNWGPTVKRSAESVSATFSPHFETAKLRVIEGYQASKDFISPHLKNVQDVTGPHIQAARETCKPYIEEAASFLRPYYKQAQTYTKPYTDAVSQGYRNFLTSATTYHSQLQVSMKGKMEKVEFLAPLASSELVWFLSAALLVLPALFTYMFLSSALGPSKKPVRTTKNHHRHGGHHKKAKRAKQVDI